MFYIVRYFTKYKTWIVGDKPRLGYIAAYSGQIGERADWEDFVPAVFDYLQPDGYFKTHEAEISGINAQISEKLGASQYAESHNRLKTLQDEADKEIERQTSDMRIAKQRRDQRRSCGDVTAEDEAAMIKESQFLKAQLRRTKKELAQKIADERREADAQDDEIRAMRERRKQLSDSLQTWLFREFDMINAKGERRNLINIFAETALRIPPSGSGECCEPKLLQYAYLHDMNPVCMAMFWWGASPKKEIRHHLHYYPACNGKCKPILQFMMQGLDVEPYAQDAENGDNKIEIIYEDQYIAVVNKPAGMLSVPGKSNRTSVYAQMRQRYPDADSPLIVHRLDMATSGLLIIAKTKEAHKQLQQQFKEHAVRKQYVAVLAGRKGKKGDCGEISLPLRADILDRPRQVVDREKGKEAVTRYEIISTDGETTRIALYPQTGRTHQLRVHCAHAEGLATPIKGDSLYGQKGERLCLHASKIEFIHPITKERMTFESKENF